MKLIKKTYKLTMIWLLPIMLIGSVFCFYMIAYISQEETDEFLTYEMERLVNYHKTYGDLPDFQNVATIIQGQKCEVPYFKDTMLLELGDNEMVPHRELRFSIIHNGRYVTIVLRHLLLGKDDIAEGTFWIILGLMVLISVLLFVIVSQISRAVWKPFYRTLDKLTQFKITDPMLTFRPTSIDEFNTLNTTINSLLKRISDDYRHKKEFGENTSHELQTHLAIIKANAEAMLNNPREAPQNLEKLQSIYRAATKLSQAQKSLLLLSKISNGEFNNTVPLKLEVTVYETLGFFSEPIDLLGIQVTTTIETCSLLMDLGMAGILINNLVKNAVKYNIENGVLDIRLTATSLVIENSGLPFSGNPETFLERFNKGKDGNLGIGLAIVKEICDLYHFIISYTITDKSTHRISILFKSE